MDSHDDDDDDNNEMPINPTIPRCYSPKCRRADARHPACGVVCHNACAERTTTEKVSMSEKKIFDKEAARFSSSTTRKSILCCETFEFGHILFPFHRD